MRALPSRDIIDAKSQARGARVTLARRFAAFIIDFFLFSGIIGVLIQILLHLLGLDQLPGFLGNYVLPLFFVFVLWPAFNQGQTLGKSLVRIKIVRTNGQPIGFLASLFYVRVCFTGWLFPSFMGLNYFLASISAPSIETKSI